MAGLPCYENHRIMRTRNRGIANRLILRGFTRGFAVILAFGVAFAYWAVTRPIQPVVIEENSSPIPNDFTLKRLGSDSVIKLSSLRGKPILVNFWASWCPPCVEEMPSLLKFSRWASDHLGLVVLGISEDEK